METAPLEPLRLRLGRNLRQWTQSELAAASGVSQARLSKLENGIEAADSEMVAVLEAALRVPTGFLTTSVQHRALPDHFYRKRQSLLKRDERWVESVVDLARQGISRLCDSVALDAPFDLPRLEVSDAQSASKIASMVRRALMIPAGPIGDLAAVIEGTGTVIVPIFGAPGKFDAMASPAMDGSPPLIFYNAEVPADRLRFNLAHEFGHLVMHHNGLHENCEDEANEFAGEFLTPTDLIRGSLRPMTLSRAVQLKRIWGVSIAYLVYNSFHRWNVVTKRQYNSLNVMISQRGWRTDEPGDVPEPRPRAFDCMIQTHLDLLTYTKQEVAGLFGLMETEFFQIHFPPDRTLRVVR